MSTLGDAVHEDLAAKGIDLDHAKIEKILAEAGVSSSVSRGVPVRLRVRRVKVSGTKQFRETEDGGDGSSEVELKTEPINLDWSPGDGVNGVGSEINLRGKSSVLHFTMWALTGRSHLQADVLGWVDRLDAEFHIDGASIYVEIVMNDGAPTGKVEQGVSSGRALLGRFNGHTEFEALMESVMLDRLRLDVISVFSQGVETEHSWPTYASALTVHADQLDPIVGNENTLKTRILQMFAGTTWAAAGAQAASALNALKFERGQVSDRRRAANSTAQGDLAAAEDRVAAAKAILEEFNPAEPDVDTVFLLASVATERAQEAHDFALQLMTARNAASEVHEHLRAEQLRAQAAAEDAVARRLFNGMTPSVCPRCSTQVTAERYAAEATEHECSLCTSDLDLDELEVQQGASRSADVSTHDQQAPEVDEDDDEDDDESVDPLVALQAAAAEADEAVTELTAAFQEAEARRAAAEAQVQKGRETLDSARERLKAELELARAEGALEQMRQTAKQTPVAPSVDDEFVVLQSAERLTVKWLKGDQDPLLVAVSEDIADLARRFGSTNITAVSLKGNGNMDVHKGGARSGYSGLTNGEKLRIKLASAIALIALGHKHGVGRHPGLLFVDSPAAEEIPEADLKTMLEAMAAVAEETDLQIVVATTHGPMLTSVLPKSNLLVATGSDFVW